MSRSHHFGSLASSDPALDRSDEFEDLSDDQFVRRFLEPAMWRVLDFPETAWWGHLQFMFSVVDLLRPRRFVELGSHHGTSFFAANQAAQRLNLSMEAVAVDSWEGEQHTGEYDESVYVGFTEVLDRRGYTNATPLKMYFDEAVELFEPDSVDLLHIDGLHTFEAVAHDYETWIDKVVPGGLVLFHDINVHQKDFGVWRLWRDLADQTTDDRSFAFHHSHGLGVLQKDGDGFPQLSRLLAILEDQPDLGSFTQLVIESVSELAHLASKLEPTQNAATLHREARFVAEGERKELQASLDRVKRELSQVWADKNQIRSDNEQLQTDKARLHQDKELLRLNREAAVETERSRLAEVEEVVRSLRLDLATSANAIRKEKDRNNTEVANAKADLSRSLAANDGLRKRNKKLNLEAARAKTRTRLTNAKAQAAQTRLRHQMERTLQIVEAESATAPPGALRRAVRRVKGAPANPATSIDIQAISERVREELFVTELNDSGLFDETFYGETYPDAGDYEDGPLLHFVRHGRFEDRQPNKFFNPAEYRKRHPDIAAHGAEPTEHYLNFGSFELRKIGETFDSPGYLYAYADVMDPADNALGHFLREGRENGHSPQPRAEKTKANVARRRDAVDRVTDRKTTIALLDSYKGQREAIDDTLVSIVMPSYNRADVLGRAIESVQAQTHQLWELIIVDDGSEDRTPEVVERFERDPRVRAIWNDHVGVSDARNAGLDAATGEFVAFLDSDNEWTPEYLRLMLTHFADTGSSSAYSAMSVIDRSGKVTSYLSSDFDWDACFEGNYVDMNVFMHRRDAKGTADEPFRFESQLKRMVDWDYILRLTRDEPASHASFVGCRYHDAVAAGDRISKSEPMIYRKMVRKRNDPTAKTPPTFAELADNLVLEFAIRISAPWGKRHVWGDTHYAQGLQAEIEKLGHKARIVYQDDGERLTRGPIDEVNLVLRGLTPYGPVPNALNILWVISHPEAVSPSEMAGYNIVYVASESHAALLQHDPKVKPRVLMQATAFEAAASADAAAEGGIVFVGNSRNVERPIVSWAAAADLNLHLYGNGWQNTSAAEHLLGTSYPNEQLPELYASADFVLNDHWESMRDFGYVSNRVFDVLAAGGSVLSDPMPSLDRFFGRAVQQIGSQDELAAAAATRPDDAERERIAAVVRSDHSFEARARQIVNDIFGYLLLDQPFDSGIGSSPPWRPKSTAPKVRYPLAAASGQDSAAEPLAIGALFMGTRLGYQSSSYIRVLSPLTTERNFPRAQVVATHDPKRLEVADLDAVIIGRTALADITAAKDLVSKTRDAGTAVVVDVDDSFASLEPGTAEYELYQPRLAALRYLIDEADAVTVSTPGIAEAFDIDGDTRTRVVANTLDPRSWRRYPRPDQVKARDPQARLRVLYMGTATHDDDFEVVVDALDEWAEVEDFELTIIGAVRNPPNRSWIRKLDVPPRLGLYPRFTHWLVDQPQFDIGLAPLRDTEFNAGKSDIKFLDYCAIGAVPVLSDVDAYAGDSHEFELAYHASSETEAWVTALSRAATEIRDGARIEERREWLWRCRNANQAGDHLIEIIDKLTASRAVG